MAKVGIDEITGKTTVHLASSGAYAGVLNTTVVSAFERLKAQAAEAGFDLTIISGFRSFSRQLVIWNAKARGQRPVLDDASNAIDLDRLSSTERIEAILRWSALPGASRHHWGTDFDIYDAAAVDAHYQVQLTPEETLGEGPFAAMHEWLDRALPGTGFYRPYAADRGGTGPERWHLSYAPIADVYAQELSAEIILSALDGVEISLRDSITDNIDAIYQRYVLLPPVGVRGN